MGDAMSVLAIINKTVRGKCPLMFFVAIAMFLFTIPLQAVTIGSWTAVAQQTTRALLPTGGDAQANTLLGFTQFDAGFLLEDAATTCTFDCDFPVQGRVALYGGRLHLNRDLTLSFIDNPFGTIEGNSFSLEFDKQSADVALPALGKTGVMNVRLLSQQTSGTSVFSVDWNYTGAYLAAVTNTALQDYSFNGATLTALHTSAIGRQVNTVRWHPSDNYLVIGCVGGAGNEFRAYQETGAALNVLAGGISLGGVLGTDATAIAWHPSGNFVVGGNNLGTNQVQSYPFTKAAGLAAAVSSVATGVVSRSALSFAPGGNYIAVGTTTSPQLDILSFSGAGAMAASTSAIVGQIVQCVDWSPTGTYIAVGLAGGTTRLTVYAHDVAAGTVTERTTARVTEANTVFAVNWDRTGRYLLVGLATNTGSEFRVYYFNQVQQTLIPLYENVTNVASNVQAAVWSHDAKFIGRGIAAAANNVAAFSATQDFSPLLCSGTDLTFNNDLTLSVSMQFNGVCNVNCRDNRIKLQDSGELIARPGANLIIENTEISSLRDTRLRCLTDNASITLRHCILSLSSDYTFSRGSLIFDNDVMVTGSCKFIYTSGMPSTINSQTQLFFDTGVTFSYAPILPRRDLLVMTDQTSVLYLNGCSLVTTRTGLQLSTGMLLLDGRTTMSSAARYTAEGIGLSSNLDIRVLGGATLDVFGIVRAD